MPPPLTGVRPSSPSSGANPQALASRHAWSRLTIVIARPGHHRSPLQPAPARPRAPSPTSRLGARAHRHHLSPYRPRARPPAPRASSPDRRHRPGIGLARLPSPGTTHPSPARIYIRINYLQGATTIAPTTSITIAHPFAPSPGTRPPAHSVARLPRNHPRHHPVAPHHHLIIIIPSSQHWKPLPRHPTWASRARIRLASATRPQAPGAPAPDPLLARPYHRIIRHHRSINHRTRTPLAPSPRTRPPIRRRARAPAPALLLLSSSSTGACRPPPATGTARAPRALPRAPRRGAHITPARPLRGPTIRQSHRLSPIVVIVTGCPRPPIARARTIPPTARPPARRLSSHRTSTIANHRGNNNNNNTTSTTKHHRPPITTSSPSSGHRAYLPYPTHIIARCVAALAPAIRHQQQVTVTVI